MKLILSAFLLALCALEGLSQSKEIEHREMLWLGYFNQTRFTNRVGMWTDLHWRLNDQFVQETHALLGRLAFTYYLTDQARLSAGYAFQIQPGHGESPDQLEHRAWQQIQWFEKKNRFALMQWLRLEQRFRKTEGQEEFSFLSHRIRYNMAFTIPLTQKEMKPKTPFVFVNNEVFINFGENIVYNYFDQNRFFVGLGYQFTSHLNAQLGYMNVFQQLPAGNEYVSTDAIRLFVFHSLDLRNKSD